MHRDFMPVDKWSSGGRVEVLSPAPRDIWHAALAADPDVLRSHTPEWIDVICAVDGWRDTSRLYRWNSGRSLVLPMVGKGSFGTVAVEASLPSGWGFGGLVGGNVTPDEAAAVYKDIATSCRISRSLCPNPLQGLAWDRATVVRVPHTTILARQSHFVDLSGGLGAVWSRFSENAKRCVRKAEKQGLEIECDTTGVALGAFHTLWMLSTERWARQHRRPAWVVRVQGKRLNPDARWKQIIRLAPGAAAIWIARYRGEPVAGIITVMGRNDHYMRGAMDKALAGPTRANFLLHWLAIQDACARGTRWYQMGQSGIQGSDVSRFKENFGARAQTFPEIRLERLPVTQVDQVLRGFAKKIIGGFYRRP